MTGVILLIPPPSIVPQYVVTMTMAESGVVKSILLASPPGQFDIIAEDLLSLLPKSSKTSLLEPELVSALRSEWETATGRSILAAAATDGGDAAGNGDAEGCIAPLSKAMDEYLASNFSSPGVRAAHDVTASTVEDKPMLVVSTYAERIDLHNNHAGSWKGCYTISPSTGSISGSIRVCAHTFENGGNVQLRSNISPEAANVGTCSPSNDRDKLPSWAKTVTRQISLWEETDVMESLADLLESMGNTYLKSLRRVMPITRTKMEWNVMSHRVVQTLGEGHDKDKFNH